MNRLTSETVTLPGGHRVPIALLGVVATLLAAVIVVRGTSRRPSTPATISTPAIGVSGQDQSGELAALQGQLGSAQHQLEASGLQVEQDKRALAQLQGALQDQARTNVAAMQEQGRRSAAALEDSQRQLAGATEKLSAAEVKIGALAGQYGQVLELETQTEHHLQDLQKSYDTLRHPAAGNPDAGWSFGPVPTAPSGFHVEAKWLDRYAPPGTKPVTVSQDPASGGWAGVISTLGTPLPGTPLAYSSEWRIAPN